MNTLRMTDQKEDADHHQSLFRSDHKCRALLANVSELQSTINEEGFQIAFYVVLQSCAARCFISPNVHLRKQPGTPYYFKMLLLPPMWRISTRYLSRIRSI